MSELVIHLTDGTVTGEADREHLAQAIRLLEKKLQSMFMDEYLTLVRQAEQMGVSLQTGEVRARGRGKEKPSKNATPLYVHPQDPSRTWNGRGRRPHWLSQLGIGVGERKEASVQ